MSFFITIFLILFFITVSLWFFGLFFIWDLSLPTIKVNKFKKILVISPHPDDEVLSAGGVIGLNTNSILFILTKGERGTPGAHLDLKLKSIRSQEAQNVSKILGAKKLVHLDLGDGLLDSKLNHLSQTITKIVHEESPDLIITNDLSGGYGHPDHIAVTETVTRLVKNKFPKVHLWYWSNPARVMKMLKLPEEMAKDKHFKDRFCLPTHKVFIGLKNINRIKAMYAYNSQFASFQKASPIKFLPIWFLVSFSVFEYFHRVN